jgi:hypothetical protein
VSYVIMLQPPCVIVVLKQTAAGLWSREADGQASSTVRVRLAAVRMLYRALLLLRS